MKTLFDAASSNDTVAAVRLLRGGGADKEARDADGFTPLMTAAEHGSFEVAKQLLEAGADKEAKEANGGTALMLAAQKGCVKVAKLLVEAGADKEAKVASGHTPLMVSARALDIKPQCTIYSNDHSTNPTHSYI